MEDEVDRRLAMVKREVIEVTDLNRRDENGSILIIKEEPDAGSDGMVKTGETWYMCTAKCGYATLSADKMKEHWAAHEMNCGKEYSDANGNFGADPTCTDTDIGRSAPNSPVYKKVQRKAKKPAECSICKKILSGSRLLEEHMKLVHPGLGLRPFLCSYCGCKFRYKRNAVRHIAIAHKTHNGGSHPCRFCPCTFTNKKGLAHHVPRFHKKKGMKNCINTETDIGDGIHVKVERAEQYNTEKSRTLNYLARKKVRCAICKKEYSTTLNLRKHIYYMHRQRGHGSILCHLCGIQMKTNFGRHMKTAHGRG